MLLSCVLQRVITPVATLFMFWQLNGVQDTNMWLQSCLMSLLFSVNQLRQAQHDVTLSRAVNTLSNQNNNPLSNAYSLSAEATNSWPWATFGNRTGTSCLVGNDVHQSTQGENLDLQKTHMKNVHSYANIHEDHQLPPEIDQWYCHCKAKGLYCKQL